MAILLDILIFIATLLLQTSLLARFHILGFTPNLMLILVITFVFYKKAYEAYIFAFLAGLVLDTLSAGPFGLHVIIYLLIVFAGTVILNEDQTKLSKLFSMVFATAAASVFYMALWFYLSYSSGRFTASGFLFAIGQITATIIFFAIFMPFLKRFFLWQKRIERA